MKTALTGSYFKKEENIIECIRPRLSGINKHTGVTGLSVSIKTEKPRQYYKQARDMYRQYEGAF